MSSIEPNWQALLIFIGCWTVVCSGWIYIGGALPLSAAPAAVRRGMGIPLVILNAVGLAALTGIALIFATQELRWTSIVVGAGFVFLFSPFVVQDLPTIVKDNQLGLILLLILLTGTMSVLATTSSVAGFLGYA